MVSQFTLLCNADACGAHVVLGETWPEGWKPHLCLMSVDASLIKWPTRFQIENLPSEELSSCSRAD